MDEGNSAGLHQTRFTVNFNPIFKPKLSLTKVSMILFSGHGGKP